MKTKTLVGIDVAKEKFYAAVLKNSKSERSNPPLPKSLFVRRLANK